MDREQEQEQEYSELGQYILALCQAQNLSLRQAALRSGLEGSTISKILRRDGVGVPTPETLDKIANGIGGDFLHMMRLAGHLPPVEPDDGDSLDIELYAKLQKLQTLVHQVAAQDPAAAARLMGLIITPFEIMLTLEEVGEVRPIEEAVSDEKKIL